MRPLLLLPLLAASAGTPPPTAALRPTPATWDSAAASIATPRPDWWTAYGDHVLTRLALEAGASDDVATAQARLDAARARARASRAALRPTLGGAANAASAQVDDIGQDSASAALEARFDPDIAGANRLRARSARADAEASAARLAATRIAARETAVRLYVGYREARAREAAAMRSLLALTDLLALAAARAQAGLVSELDTSSARAARDAQRSRVVAARQAADETRLGLEALLGRAPGTLRPELASPASVPRAALSATLLTPVAVIATRPDLVAAERDLAAAGFDARAARADYWPRLTLGGVLGAQAVDPTTAFTGAGVLTQLLGSITAPLFQGGRLAANRDVADARVAESAAAYRSAVGQALAEVERALIATGSAEQRSVALGAARAAAVDQSSLARARYRGGLVNFFEVQTAERAVFDAEAELATAQADAGRAFAALNAALGLGG